MIRISRVTVGGAALVAMMVLSSIPTVGQSRAPGYPAYRIVESWPQLPSGLKLGAVPGIQIGPDGHIYAFHRCGANSCANSNDPAILKFDRSGKLLKSWGAGMFVWPHGIFVDRDGSVWVTDARGEGGKGHQVFKFTSDGKLVMTLGTKGVAGNGQNTFNGPADVAVAPNGDIFVTDGHACNNQNRATCTDRVVKFSKDGKFIKAWGKRGSRPGEFRMVHCLFIDSRSRVIVCDRNNVRLQVFDVDGKLLETWTGFGKPTGIFITKDDTMYVADSLGNIDSNGNADPSLPNIKPGLYIGSAKDGSVKSFIPDEFLGAEDVTADDRGDIYVAEAFPQTIRKFILDPARLRLLGQDLR